MASEKTVQPETLRYSADAGNAELSALCGPLDENLRQIETILNVRVSRRGDVFRVTGELEAARRAVTANAVMAAAVEGIIATIVHVMVETVLADVTTAALAVTARRILSAKR